MKKVLIVCLLAAAVSMAQRQRVAVLPSIADPETKLSARELDVLTDKLRGYASDVLPLADFVLLKQDFVKEKLGDEALFKACKEGTCVGDLIAKVQADFGARCDVFSVSGKLWLKFELYGTLRGEDEAGTISTFSESVKDLKAMEAAIEKRVPDAFRKILSEVAPAALPPAQYAAASGNYVAEIVTEPAGAVLSMNGMPLRNCPKTPCRAEFYENKLKISAALDEHETLDTAITITQPNQLVKISLKQTTYYVDFASDPPGAKLVLDREQACPQTPCGMRFKKGGVQVSASKELYESLDTTVFVSGDSRSFNIKLNPNYGILNINKAYSNGIGINEDWRLTAGGEPATLGEVGEIKLLPGEHEVMLTHNCYEDIKLNARIERGMKTNFDMHGWLALKQSTLVLKAKRKGRNISKQALVNGKQVETPYEGFVPLCSDIEIQEKEMADNVWKKIDVELKHNESVEYTYRDGTLGSHLFGLALDAIGVIFLMQSHSALNDRDGYRDEYVNLKSGGGSFDAAWKKVEDANFRGNVFLIIGGVALASGIGVHIWF